MKNSNFFTELKRRNVYKVAVAYAFVGWLVIQISSTVLPTFHAPEWVVQTLVVLVALGFPIALVIAWAFELTPEGLKRTEDVDGAPQKQGKSGAWIYVVAVGAVLSIGLFFLGRHSASNNAAPRQTETGSSIPQKSIAVLPFENLSDDKNAAYFADGIQDEILTKLAGIRDLKVISRTSTAKYKSKPEDLKTVSQQLGVATVLEGSVQKAGDKVRINVQLIDARADSHLWAKSYDREIQDIFAVESEVAQEIADSLQAKLSPAESAQIASVPTKNPAAYDLFLKGQYLFNQLQTSAANDPVAAGREGTDFYRRAIAADPDFALAYARLSYLDSYLHWYGVDRNSAVIEEARSAAKHALALQPDFPEGHLALGYFHYWGQRDYPAALSEFAIARSSLPNNADVIAAIGYVHRRQGVASRGIPELLQACVLDPRNSLLPREIANSYTALRNYAEADASYARSLAIFPGDMEAQEQRAANAMYRGDTAGAGRMLAAIPSDPQGAVSLLRFKLAMLTRQPDAALAAIAHSPDWLMTRWEHSVAPLSLLRGQALALKGEAEPAHVAFREAEKQLQSLLGKPHEVADAQSYLGLVYAGLDQKEAALKAGRAALALLPMSLDIIVGAFHLERLARVEAQVGETQSAIDHLEQLMSSAGGETVSIATLRIDPVWDPLRKDPRFQKLIAEEAKP
jgi:TolB-like protein/Tfp pilus assembly protein PilF